MDNKIQLMIQYASLLSFDFPPMYLRSKLEDCPNATGEYFFYVQSTLKYRSWLNVHNGL